jgi:hypothetical protein
MDRWQLLDHQHLRLVHDAGRSRGTAMKSIVFSAGVLLLLVVVVSTSNEPSQT